MSSSFIPTAKRSGFVNILKEDPWIFWSSIVGYINRLCVSKALHLKSYLFDLLLMNMFFSHTVLFPVGFFFFLNYIYSHHPLLIENSSNGIFAWNNKVRAIPFFWICIFED